MRYLINIFSKLTGQTTVFPFYHCVTNSVPLHLLHLYKIKDPISFEEDVRFFVQHFQPVSLFELSKTTNSKPKVCFTFDDGLREFKEQAWPILKKYNVPVTLFVNPAFVDNIALFFRFKSSLLIEALLNYDKLDFLAITDITGKLIQSKDNLRNYLLSVTYQQQQVLDQLSGIFDVDFNTYLQKYKPYLTLDELRELDQQGVIIGAHSVDHPLFNELSFDEQLTQIETSIDWVTTNFNSPIKAFSFPFTDFGLKATLFDVIYRPVNQMADFTFGTAGLKNELYNRHFQRIPMEDYKGSAKIAILHQYLYYLAKIPFNRNTIHR